VKLDKRTIFEEGLADPEVEVMVFDVPGLIAPSFLQYPTVFRYGLNMPNPIPDLVCDEHGISATLSFNQTPHETFVPWAAVLGILLKYRGIGISWQPDDRVELPAPTTTKKTKLGIVKASPPPTTTKPSLKIVREP
jgi:hypothetical protein